MPCPFLVREQVIGKHPHPEPAKNLPRNSPDLARADEPRSLSVEVETHQPVERKIQLPHAVECPMCLAVQSEQQGNGVFSDRVRRVDRYPRNSEIQLSGGG